MCTMYHSCILPDSWPFPDVIDYVEILLCAGILWYLGMDWENGSIDGSNIPRQRPVNWSSAANKYRSYKMWYKVLLQITNK